MPKLDRPRSINLDGVDFAEALERLVDAFAPDGTPPPGYPSAPRDEMVSALELKLMALKEEGGDEAPERRPSHPQFDRRGG